MTKLKWGFAIFIVLFAGLFIAGHVETDGKSTGLVLSDPPAVEKKISVFDGHKVTTVEIPRKNKPLFPKIHKFFHPNRD